MLVSTTIFNYLSPYWNVANYSTIWRYHKEADVSTTTNLSTARQRDSITSVVIEPSDVTPVCVRVHTTTLYLRMYTTHDEHVIM